MPAFDLARFVVHGEDIVVVLAPEAFAEWPRVKREAFMEFVIRQTGCKGVAVAWATSSGRYDFFGEDRWLPMLVEAPPGMLEQHINGRLEWDEQQGGDERTSGEHGEYRLN
jgi:hypothetical protein